jgi:signal peptidase I
MQDTILEGEFLLVNRTSYWFFQPDRGDVIVFKYPLQDNNTNFFKSIYEVFLKMRGTDVPIRRHLIKRVIALPGEEISIRDGIVYIDGSKLDENYQKTPPDEDFGPLRVPEGSYFVMGDNRDESRDSRVWGFVEKDLIIGKAFLIYYSVIPSDECPGDLCYGKPVRMKGDEGSNSEIIYRCPVCNRDWRDYWDYRKTGSFDLFSSIRWSRLCRMIK